MLTNRKRDGNIDKQSGEVEKPQRAARKKNEPWKLNSRKNNQAIEKLQSEKPLNRKIKEKANQ